MAKHLPREPLDDSVFVSGFIEHEGRRYEVIRASDVINDGMWLELNDVTAGGSEGVLSAFWSDKDSGFDFYANRSPVPFVLVEYFLGLVRTALTPVDDHPS